MTAESQASHPSKFADVLGVDDRTPFNAMFDFEAQGISHPVLVEGTGPAVLLMHELPGFVPEFWRLAHWIKAAGFRVYAPALYGLAKSPHEEVVHVDGLVGGMARACVSREIRLFARSGGSPISNWLRTLASHAHSECGGPGVGTVGLCLSGNFAWSVAVAPSVVAAVAADPALPFNNAGSIHLDPHESRQLAERENLEVMALRFEGDPSCKAQRFKALRGLLGDKLETRVLPDTSKNPKGNPVPHGVLTKDLIAQDGQPTFEAARDVLAFLSYRLKR